MQGLSPDTYAGRRLGDRYEITQPIGSGGSGIVYDARHLWTQQRVALKVLRPELACDAAGVGRFMREARLAADLNHPNVVRILDMGRIDEAVYLAMERLEGQSLRERLEGAPLGVAQTVRVLLPVVDALATAHHGGVLHRDITPGNIFLAQQDNGDEVPKLLDFGLAKRPGDEAALTDQGVIVGTPQYMSPEQARGDGPVDARTDVWGIGAVAYECLRGAPAFSGGSATTVLMQILTEQAPRLVDALPEAPHLARVLDRCLSKEPGDRPADAGELGRALREACQQDGVATELSGSNGVAADASAVDAPRSTLPWVVVAAAALALGLGAWLSLSDSGSPSAPGRVIAPLPPTATPPPQPADNLAAHGPAADRSAKDEPLVDAALPAAPAAPPSGAVKTEAARATRANQRTPRRRPRRSSPAPKPAPQPKPSPAPAAAGASEDDPMQLEQRW